MTDDRYDGWVNDLTALGSIRDKSTGMGFRQRARLDASTLNSLYEQHAIAARIVDLPVDEAFRTGWTIKDIDADVDVSMVHTWIDDLNFVPRLKQALKWSRLYGAAVLALPTSDPNPALPLRPGSPMFTPVPFSAQYVTPREYDDGFGSATYRQVLQYELSTIGGKQICVHHSRVLKFEPIELPPEVAHTRQSMWGPSVLDRVFDDLSAWGAARGHAINIMYVASLLYLKLQGFREDRSRKGGPERMRQRLAECKQSLDQLGIFGLDIGDDLGSLSMSTGTTHELMDRLRDAVAAASDMPREIIFNESPSGLNAGELSGPQEIWFGKVEAYRKSVITPAIDKYLELLFAWKGIVTKEWQIEWDPLWVPSSTTRADVAVKWAGVDNIYYQMGLDPETILHQRFVDGNDSYLHMTAPSAVEPLDIESEMAAQQAGAAPVDAGLTPADTALNGEQISGVLEILKSVKSGEITYDQGIGALGLAFPTTRGREAAILGPRPAEPDPAEVAAAEADPLNGPSDDPIPADVVSPREAADKYRVSTRTITRMMETAAIRYWGLGAHKRVSLSDIAKAARSHEQPATEEPDGAAEE